MNIMFISPSFPNHVKEYLILPSLNVCIMSSILKAKGHSVDMIDMKIDSLSIDGLKSELLKHETPQIVCIDDEVSTHCISLKVADLIKETYGSYVKVAFIGDVVSFVPEDTLKRHENVDFVIRYDDDYALLKIIDAIEHDSGFGLISNIAFRAGEYIKVNKVQPRDYALDSLPMPDRRVYDIAKYLKRDSETIVRSSRGCPGQCLFCSKTLMAKFGVFSFERFCNEIAELQGYGFESFFFSDDTFAFSDERLKGFYNEVLRRKMDIRWTSNIRIKDINEYKISRMKEIGAYRVFVGIETVNSKTSSVIKKNLVKDEIKKKIDILHKYNMEFHASFILGNPGDTEEDLGEMLEFVKEINPTLATFNLIRVLPGIELYNSQGDYGIQLNDKYWYESDEWSKRVIAGTKDLPPEKLEKWSRRLLFELMK